MSGMQADSERFFETETALPAVSPQEQNTAPPRRSALSHVSPPILLKGLQKHAVWILLCAVFGAVGGLGLAWNIAPTYEARTVMIRHIKNTNVNASLYQEPEIRTLLETVKLRENLLTLKTRLQLDASPEALYQRIDVKPGQRSDIIQILATAPTPQEASAIAQTMSEIFQASSAGLSQNVARRVYQFRLTQRKRFEERLQAAQQALSQFQKKHNIAFFEDSTRLLLEQIKQFELDLERARIAQNRDKEAIASIDAKLQQRPENIRVTQTVRYRNRVRYQELASELKGLLQRYTPENPKVIALQTQMQALKAEGDTAGIPEEESYGMDPVVRELKIDQAERMTAMGGHQRTIQQLQKQIKDLRGQLKKLAILESDVANLQRQIDRENENLRENDYRLSESENDMEARISAFDILEPASAPEAPLPTRRKLLVLAGGFLGALTGMAGSLGSTLLKPNLSDARQVEALGMEYLGSLSPHNHAISLALGYRMVNLGKALADSETPSLILISGTSPERSRQFMDACKHWFSQQEIKIACVQPPDRPVLPTHDLGHWLYEKDAPLPCPLQKEAHLSSFAFVKQNRLPLLNKLSQLASPDPIQLILWELPSPAVSHDLFIQLSAQAQTMIWVLDEQHSPHQALRNWLRSAAELNHKGVWYESST